MEALYHRHDAHDPSTTGVSAENIRLSRPKHSMESIFPLRRATEMILSFHPFRNDMTYRHTGIRQGRTIVINVTFAHFEADKYVLGPHGKQGGRLENQTRP